MIPHGGKRVFEAAGARVAAAAAASSADKRAAKTRAGPALDREVASDIARSFWRGDGRPADVLAELETLLLRRAGRGDVVGPAAYTAAISVLGARKRPKEAEALHHSMAESSVAPTGDTYGALLSAFVRGGRPDRIPFVWHKMVNEDGVTPNDACFEALVCAYSTLGDHRGCAEAFAEMRRAQQERRQTATTEVAQPPPGPTVLLAVLASFPKLTQAQAFAAEHSRVLAAHEQTPLALLKVCARSKDNRGAQRVFDAHRTRCGSPELYCGLARVLAACGRRLAAADVLRGMPQKSRGAYQLLLALEEGWVRRVGGDGCGGGGPKIDAFEPILEAALAEFETYSPFYEAAIRLYMACGRVGEARRHCLLARERGVPPSKTLLELEKLLDRTPDCAK